MLLPEPVGATDSTSRPASWASTTSAWPGRNSWYLKTWRRTSTGVGTAPVWPGRRPRSKLLYGTGRLYLRPQRQAGVAEFVLTRALLPAARVTPNAPER